MVNRNEKSNFKTGTTGYQDPEVKNKTTEEYVDNLILAISRVSAAISGLIDLDAILSIGLETTFQFMGGKAGGIMLLDEENGMLSYRVTRGLSHRYTEEMYMKLGEGIAGKVAQSGKVMLIDDISLEPDAARPDLIDLEGLKGFISVPLKAREKVLGVMNVASQKPSSFTKRDIYTCKSIGDQLGTAIEQARLYKRLQKSKERYRLLAQRIIVAQEKERKKIARDLHDETSQILAGLALNLQALTEMTDNMGIRDDQFVEILRKSHASTVQVHSEISRLIADLRPTQLDTLGLVAAIRQYVSSIIVARGIKVHFDMDAVEKHLLPEEELSLFRLVQGAVGNIIQHSEAKNITVSIKYQDDKLVVSVIDDGKGFEVEKLTELRKIGRGYGLLNMKERMTLIGATCSVQSQPGEGTIVRAVLPLSGKVSIKETKPK